MLSSTQKILDSFQNGRKTNLRDDLFSAIESLILSGQLIEGQRINELEITKQLGISRTPLRQAVQKLVQEDLIKVVPNVGNVVQTNSRQDFMEIGLIRKNLWPEVFLQASQKMTIEDFEDLDQLFQLIDTVYKEDDISAAGDLLNQLYSDVLAFAQLSRISSVLNQTNSASSKMVDNTFKDEDNARKVLKRFKTISNKMRKQEEDLKQLVSQQTQDEYSWYIESLSEKDTRWNKRY
ncbi:MAG: GntR family transcriptional regulator [Lactobacillaceae bacterium]|nr:GntR family transcriptional regulator [Lactobacillaceae bacterium]